MKHGLTKEARLVKISAKLDRDYSGLIDKLKEQYSISKNAIVECRKLLVKIHEFKRWEKTHTSFGDFVRDTLGISRAHAYRLIDFAELVNLLPKELQDKITNEHQSRAVSSLPESVRTDAIKNAVSHSKNGHGITAREITKEGQKLIGRSVSSGDSRGSVKPESETVSKEEKPQFDKVGTLIPKDALVYWKRQQEVQDILTQISKLKGIVIRAREKEDCLWMNVDNYVEERFDQLHSVISQAKGYAVCTQCMGSPSLQPTGCSLCHSTGLIAKWKWDSVAPEELKDIRLKSNIEYAKKHGLNMPIGE
jgi:hypothetical protein